MCTCAYKSGQTVTHVSLGHLLVSSNSHTHSRVYRYVVAHHDGSSEGSLGVGYSLKIEWTHPDTLEGGPRTVRHNHYETESIHLTSMQ